MVDVAQFGVGAVTMSRRAVLVGHLAVSPPHASIERCEELHADPDVAHQALHDLLASAALDGSIVAGPLWPHPALGLVTTGFHRVVPAFVG